MAAAADRTLWVLHDGTPTPVGVTVGACDGHVTQILAGDLADGEPVIIDAVPMGG
jgi:hypothetical protein